MSLYQSELRVNAILASGQAQQAKRDLYRQISAAFYQDVGKRVPRPLHKGIVVQRPGQSAPPPSNNHGVNAPLWQGLQPVRVKGAGAGGKKYRVQWSKIHSTL